MFIVIVTRRDTNLIKVCCAKEKENINIVKSSTNYFIKLTITLSENLLGYTLLMNSFIKTQNYLCQMDNTIHFIKLNKTVK